MTREKIKMIRKEGKIPWNKDICIFCGKGIDYPEGIRLRGGIDAHMTCFKLRRQKQLQAILNNEK